MKSHELKLYSSNDFVGDFVAIFDDVNKKTYKEITKIFYIKNSKNAIALQLDYEENLYLITYEQFANLNKEVKSE